MHTKLSFVEQGLGGRTALISNSLGFPITSKFTVETIQSNATKCGTTSSSKRRQLASGSGKNQNYKPSIAPYKKSGFLCSKHLIFIHDFGISACSNEVPSSLSKQSCTLQISKSLCCQVINVKQIILHNSK